MSELDFTKPVGPAKTSIYDAAIAMGEARYGLPM